MTPKHKTIASLSVLIILIAAALYYILKNIGQFKKISLIHPLFLIPLIIIFLLGYICVALITKSLLYPLKINLTDKEAYALSIITGFYNLITPFRGGALVRAIYLKKRYNFAYTKFISTLSASYILIFIVASLIGIFSIGLIYINQKMFSPVLLLIFLIVLLPLLAIAFFSPKFPKSKSHILNKIIEVINGWHKIKNNSKIIITTSSLTLIQLIFSSLMFLLEFNVFGFEITFPQAMLLTSITSLSILISITPASLGISEAITVFTALAIGISPVQSLSVAILGRLISFSTLFALGPIFSYLLLKQKK